MQRNLKALLSRVRSEYSESYVYTAVENAEGNPPDKVTKYDHVHLFDESGNPIDINLNVVDRKSSDAHIPIRSR